MGRAIHMENDISDLKSQISNIQSSIKNIEKELTGLSKLQSIVNDASKPKSKPKTTKKGGNHSNARG